MPQFDLRGMKVAKYQNTNGVISYATPVALGDAMNVNIDLRFAEGRLYAESVLAEYVREPTGGTISVGTKYIKKDAEVLMFGCTAETDNDEVVYTGKDNANYVGYGAYAPDKIDGVTKFTAFFIHKTMFGPPGYSLQTKGENIQFSTPTTSGEFLPDDSADKKMLSRATLATEAAAIAWINTKFGVTGG